MPTPVPGPEPDLPLGGRRVVLYVSGSIAAYKAGAVVTALRRLGAQVRVAMTPSGARFVSPMTFQALTAAPVATSMWPPESGGPVAHGMAHIDLAQWAELQVAAPASADLLARLALGLADDVVSATALSSPAPMVVAPAMETGMWEHAATQAHLGTLRSRGVTVLEPATGRLASGHHGSGRMVEPEAVVAAVVDVLSTAGEEAWLQGHRVVVTAGGTREAIDPIRYIGSRSSGKMGHALAAEALRLGAEVTLVTAAPPPPPGSGLEVVEAETAGAMLAAVERAMAGASVLIMAAAVADYRPARPAAGKIKKGNGRVALELEPTPDILHAVRRHPDRPDVVVGFAAETENLLDNARAKLLGKGLDLIVANPVGSPDVGMGADDNAAVVLGADGVVAEVPRAPKAQVARAVFRALRPQVERVRSTGSAQGEVADVRPPG